MTSPSGHILELRHQLHDILVTIPYGIVTLSDSGSVTTINSIAARLLCISDKKLSQVVDRPASELLKELPQVLAACRQVNSRSSAHREADLDDIEIGGCLLHVRLKKMLHGSLICIEDRTEIKKLQENLFFRASHDGLTRLLNRNEFISHLNLSYERISRTNNVSVLAYIDLDRFKPVNDLEGHAAGDTVIENTAEMLQELTRSRDSVGRIGGDEFALLLDNCSLEDGLRKLEKLRSAVAKHRYVFDGRAYQVTVSIGVVAISAEYGSPEDILDAADIACRRAKLCGHNRIEVYMPDSAELTSLREGTAWLPRINAALEAGAFVLFQQPIVAARTREAYASEMLVRLEQGDDIILPDAFIPSAERYDKMAEIDTKVIVAAFRLHQPGARSFINLSGQSLSRKELRRQLESLTTEYRVEPGEVVFEVTETAAIRNFDVALDFCNFLKSAGYGIALDDFGTGLSSFAYIRDLPLDYVKIDGSFVRGVLDDVVHREIVRAIIQICKATGISSIAEYVENDQIAACLQNMEVDFLQGFAIGRPEPLRGADMLTAERS